MALRLVAMVGRRARFRSGDGHLEMDGVGRRERLIPDPRRALGPRLGRETLLAGNDPLDRSYRGLPYRPPLYESRGNSYDSRLPLSKF